MALSDLKMRINSSMAIDKRQKKTPIPIPRIGAYGY